MMPALLTSTSRSPGLLDAAGGTMDRLIGGHVQVQEPRAGGRGGDPSAIAAAGREIHPVTSATGALTDPVLIPGLPPSVSTCLSVRFG